MGAHVIAVETSAERRALALEKGAHAVIDPADVDPVTAIQDLTHGEGAHKVIETAGVPQARSAAVKGTRKWGTACFVATNGEVTLDVGPDLTFRQVTVLGHWTFSKNGQADCARFVTDRKIDVDSVFTHQFQLEQAEEALEAETGTLLTLMKRLHVLLVDHKWPGYVPPEEVVFAREVLRMAAQQKHVYRESYAAEANKIPGYEAKLREFEKACDPFIERAKEHKNPVPKNKRKVETPESIPPANLHLKLVDAKDHLGKAAAAAKVSDRAKALASQQKAVESLRHLICEYALKFAVEAPPLGESDAISPVYIEKDDIFQLFVPGVLTGKRPPDGRLEWEVLAKRDRAALNENFARELPLEFRAILKDYYERLTK